MNKALIGIILTIIGAIIAMFPLMTMPISALTDPNEMTICWTMVVIGGSIFTVGCMLLAIRFGIWARR